MAPSLIADSASAEFQAPQPSRLFQRVYWTREPHLRKLYGLAIILMVASATTGYDGMLVNTSQQIDSWNSFFFPELVDRPSDAVADSRLAILVNMFNIGSIVSFFFTPYVADHYGRRPAIVAGCIFMVMGGLLTAFCTGYGMYMGGRFMLGFGNSLSQMASPLLLTEICHPQHRGPVTAIYNCLWNAGALLVSCIAWGTANITTDWSWRSITFLQVVPSLIQLAGIWWIPESPRFLANKDRHDEALHILAKWHAGGDVNNATVQFEFREIKETIRIQKATDQSTRYLDFLRTKGNRWRLAIIVSLGIISQYSGNALFSNYMNTIYQGAGIRDQNQKLAMSTGKTILDVIVTIAAALNVNRFGRRPLFLISTFGMVGSFVCWTIAGAIYENSFEGNKGSGYAQLVFIWVFGIFYDIGFSGLLVAYALEVLPFHLRAKGMMIMNITVQACLAIGNQTNKLAWERLPHHWNFMLFYTLWDLCELVFVWLFYVETNGPTLEEVARIFDGDGAIAHIDMQQVQKEIFHNEHRDTQYVRDARDSHDGQFATRRKRLP
ncbi:general substrate transporter [Lasiosphaeria miniovina]|uniref:General substrate transporter n=1 Tax=Lasiosphaeria miniovina TaxID=1954250 RepID=A0AA40A6X2_9PEZI|nr:general substrate transporter [Lasiosphaeria miniovina]KAK0710320.1 general substrate transporter [Lasiosphaeria miniovina]